MRDDFPEDVKRNVAARVGNVCSNPQCHALTSGPQDDPAKSLNVGVAAHITSAASGGPRYNAALTGEERRSSENAIWLCQNCAKLVDNDVSQFTEKLLQTWKTIAEHEALSLIGKTRVESKKAQYKLATDFSELMLEGKKIADRISQLSGEQLAGWESELESWKQRVTDFMTTAGWQTEVVPFLQADDKAEPVQGVDNIGLKRERRRRRMALYNQKLDDIAQRRIAR